MSRPISSRSSSPGSKKRRCLPWGNLQNILLADVGKLQTVGTNVNNPAWALSTTTTQDAVNLLNVTTARAVYSALVPATWQLYNLKPDPQSQPPVTSADVAQYVCGTRATTQGGIPNHPFANALPANQFQARFQMVPSAEPSTTEVWTFANVNNSNFHSDPDGSTSLPTSSLTDQLFSTGEGGAAAYPPAWYRKTYKPPSYAICGYNGGNAYAPPVIFGPPEVDDTDG
jgi:hypothetical protein